MQLFPPLLGLTRARFQLRKKLTGAGRHILLVVGGVIPPSDIPLLERGGVQLYGSVQNPLMRQ